MSNKSKENEMPEYIYNLLKEAGWHKDRVLDIEDTLAILESEGFTVFQSVRDFLYSFNGLEFEFGERGSTDNVSFNVKETIEGISTGWVLKEYSSRVKKELCLIGRAFGGYMVLCMDSEGQVYAGYDQQLFFFGESWVEALSVIVLRKKARKID